MRLRRSILVAIAAAAFLLSGAAAWFFFAMTAELEHPRASEYIKIESGSSTERIVTVLSEKGLLRSPFAVRVYLRILGDPKRLKAGEYRFKSPITALEILEELRKGNQRTKKLTIPEGWTRFEIADRIASRFPGDPPADAKAVLYLMKDTAAIKEMAPKAVNLEGFLYPTTYNFPLKTSPEVIISKMTEQFKEVWRPEWTLRARKLDRKPYEIVTIASLIENETKVEAERSIVASVIYNRLERGMPLGIDATNVYIAKMLGRWDGTIHKSDIEIDHPYNTRRINGLPPGPISSASESALLAALHPARTDYLFYVRNVDKNDGSHHFYSSAAEFEKGKARYQRWLREQRNRN